MRGLFRVNPNTRPADTHLDRPPQGDGTAMGSSEQITPDQTYDTTGTVDDLTLDELDQLEAEGANDDAEALLTGGGVEDDEPDPEAEKAWVELADEEPEGGSN